ncbi:hypothetical protein AOLI_G00292160 [Acnodon oligacanthus]
MLLIRLKSLKTLLHTLEFTSCRLKQRMERRAVSTDANLLGDFTAAELSAAINKLKSGKSLGQDNIHPEFVILQSDKTSRWLCLFFSACFRRVKLPKIWSWRGRFTAALSQWWTHNFRRNKLDQVTLLTQDIKESFQDNEKARVVFLDLTAGYDTVWHRGLHLKLLRIIPYRHTVRFIMEMLVNCSFIVHTSDGQTSRLQRLKNGVLQGSILSPMLFNIYIHDLPDTTATKYGYTDYLVIMVRRPTWKALEDGLFQ